ncbi:DUF3574 domain-containing protein [soil metagenome]
MLKRITQRALLLLVLFMLTLSTPTQAKTLDSPLQHEGHTQSSAQQKFAGEVWRRTELYFGTNKPDGSHVTDAAFKAFVDLQVTSRFPDGLTLLNGYGQFRNSAGAIVQEKSFVLILLYPLNVTDASSEVEAIRQAYKDTFQQESVLRIDSISFVSF